MEKHPSPFGWFFASRKGLLTLFTFIVAVVFAVVVGVQVVRDKITVEAGLGFCGGGLLAWFAIAFKTIDAIEKEPAKTPSVPPLPILLFALAAFALGGCAVSFEEARGVSSIKPLYGASSPAFDRSSCIKLDNSRQLHDALSKGSFAIALGTAGFPGVIQAVKDEGASKELVVGTVIGAAVVAGAGVFFHVRAEGKAETYIRECTS